LGGLYNKLPFSNVSKRLLAQQQQQQQQAAAEAADKALAKSYYEAAVHNNNAWTEAALSNQASVAPEMLSSYSSGPMEAIMSGFGSGFGLR
jgi:4-diphosphocytidyl-2C-methyl-D-erythritol kinase